MLGRQMAGYLFTFSNSDEMKECISNGCYSTLMSPTWSNPTSGTLGDYVTMRAGDNVYFFSERKIYGIGRIVDVELGRCVTENFVGATSKNFVIWEDVADEAILNRRDARGRIPRWVIAFEQDPFFFGKGIDMDDLLSSNPSAFRSLRVFWKRSFIKLDDEENEAFRASLLRANLPELNSRYGEVPSRKSFESLAAGAEPNVPALLASSRTPDGSLTSEYLLEVGLLYQLARFDPLTCEAFGKWDYLSHQVAASPFKPVDYMDHMDVFGYRWIKGYRPVIECYLVAELKKDRATSSDVPQVMKYVDWVHDEYAHGDYSLIQAFLVAHRFVGEVTSAGSSHRDYIVGHRPAEARTWKSLSFVTYFVRGDGYIVFHREG